MNRRYTVCNGVTISKDLVEGEIVGAADSEIKEKKEVVKERASRKNKARVSVRTDEDPLGIYSSIRAIIQQEVEKGVAAALAQQQVYLEDLFSKNASKNNNSGLIRTYTVEQVCEMLKCSEPTYYRIARQGVFKTLKRGRTTLILAEDFDRKLLNNYFLHIH